MLSQGMLDDVRQAVTALRKGGVVVYPCDTLWGLGCDATQPEAVARLYALKERQAGKAMLCLVDGEARAEAYAEGIPEVAWQLWEVTDRPLTLVLDKGKNVAPALLAPNGTIGLRITREPFSQELCRRLGRPIVSTSANKSGAMPPQCFAEISKEVIAEADYVCTSRREEAPVPNPSTIIRLTRNGEISIIRP